MFFKYAYLRASFRPFSQSSSVTMPDRSPADSPAPSSDSKNVAEISSSDMHIYSSQVLSSLKIEQSICT